MTDRRFGIPFLALVLMIGCVMPAAAQTQPTQPTQQTQQTLADKFADTTASMPAVKRDPATDPKILQSTESKPFPGREREQATAACVNQVMSVSGMSQDDILRSGKFNMNEDTEARIKLCMNNRGFTYGSIPPSAQSLQQTEQIRKAKGMPPLAIQQQPSQPAIQPAAPPDAASAPVVPSPAAPADASPPASPAQAKAPAVQASPAAAREPARSTSVFVAPSEGDNFAKPIFLNR